MKAASRKNEGVAMDPGIPRIKFGVSPGYVNRLRIASNPQ